jgi:hypothetical protein
VKGEGFVRPPDVIDPMTPPPRFDVIGEEYVRQIVDLWPGLRKRYLGQLTAVAPAADHGCRAEDGDDGLLPASADDAAISRAKEGVGSARDHRSLAQHPSQVAIPVAG